MLSPLTLQARLPKAPRPEDAAPRPDKGAHARLAGFRVWASPSWVKGLGFRIQGLIFKHGCRVLGIRFFFELLFAPAPRSAVRYQGLGFRDQGLGFSALGLKVEGLGQFRL